MTAAPGAFDRGREEDGLLRWMADLDTAAVPLHPFMGPALPRTLSRRMR